MYLSANCDAPNDPTQYFGAGMGMRVVYHRPCGFVPLDLTQLDLYLTPAQERDEFVGGRELWQTLTRRSLVNANFLDAMRTLVRAFTSEEEKRLVPKLVPSRFRRNAYGFHQYVFAWGTVYENPAGEYFVRYFTAMGDPHPKLYFGYVSLKCDHFRRNDPALVLG